jgi:hypothetical protein
MENRRTYETTEVTARQSHNQKTLATEGTEFTEILAKTNEMHRFPRPAKMMIS